METKEKELAALHHSSQQQIETLALRLRAAETANSGMQAHYEAREAKRAQRINELSTQVGGLERGIYILYIYIYICKRESERVSETDREREREREIERERKRMR